VPRFDPNAIPYVEAANWSKHLQHPQPKSVVVLHCMEWPEKPDSAEWCAGFFAGTKGPAPQASAHYCVDADSVICCVPPDRVAWHAPGANANGIGIEHAGYARQTAAQWLDDYSLRMLQLSAELTAWLCKRFGIPVQFIGAEHLRRGARGITTHAEVSRAFGKSTHMDPGPFFPINEYVRFIGEAGQRG
jgi:N-acetyl-anhydromuramyl-L-alanine amidase AmpD